MPVIPDKSTRCITIPRRSPDSVGPGPRLTPGGGAGFVMDDVPGSPWAAASAVRHAAPEAPGALPEGGGFTRLQGQRPRPAGPEGSGPDGPGVAPRCRSGPIRRRAATPTTTRRPSPSTPGRAGYPATPSGRPGARRGGDPQHRGHQRQQDSDAHHPGRGLGDQSARATAGAMKKQLQTRATRPRTAVRFSSESPMSWNAAKTGTSPEVSSMISRTNPRRVAPRSPRSWPNSEVHDPFEVLDHHGPA